MQSPKFHTRFNPPLSSGIRCDGGLTDQHFKDECDLNVILKRYRGNVPPASVPGIYADLTELPSSLSEAFDRVQFAQEWFDGLPSDVRQSFRNDPRAALQLLMTNPSAAVAAGLLPRSDVPEAEGIHGKAVETATPEPKGKGKGDEVAVETVEA